MARHKLVEQIVGDLSFTNSSPFSKLLDSCLRSKSLRDTRRIHARIIKSHFSSEIYIQNRLIHVYAKCGHLDDARKINEARYVFDMMPIRNVVSETSMVSGYAKASTVKAARSMFTKMMERNVVSWNALIAGYTQNGENEEALGLFCLLKREAVCPTHYTFGNLLNACANLADLQLGRQAHTHMKRVGYVPNTGDYDASGEEDISKSASYCQTNLPIDAGIDSGPQCGGKNLALRYCVLIKKPTYNLQIVGPTDLSLKRTKHSNATGEHLDLLASFLAS
ncbi:hypothetical protein Patl1_27978 [Pistacia atlantica]|uniref:Uncharacterized protein n=1 Tax=Pistacia atlantica TaxID=434234 RepID=A0ACC1BE11_9ROSI|nr:hypothetical protein Patl1_27978 [Pistacia atlantica]